MRRFPLLFASVVYSGFAGSAPAQQAISDDQQATQRPQVEDASRDVLSPLTVLASASSGLGTRLTLAPDSFARLRGGTLRLTDFPLGAARSITLELHSFQVTGPGATIVEGTDDGDVAVPYPDVLLFRGRVEDAPDSWVFLGVTPDRINGIVHVSDAEEFIVAPLDERIAARQLDTHVVFERFSTDANSLPPNLLCTAVPRGPAAPPPSSRRPAPAGFGDVPPGGGGGTRGVTDRVCWVAIDCDWEYRNLSPFSSVADATAYAIELIGVVNVIYERDVRTRMYINFLRVWNTVNDPYDAVDTAEQLPEFENFFHNNVDPLIFREVNHLFSGRDLGGGRAFIDVLCDGYGVSGNLAGTFPRPAQDLHANNWDIVVVPHEIGHNFGSPHTHCFDPPIDTCAGLSYDCPHVRVCQQSELMSYCHLCPGGTANIRLRFEHPAVLAQMREDVGCLRAVIPTCYVDGAWHGAENGNPPTPYNKVLKGFMGVSEGGTIRIRQGTYPEPVTLDRGVTLENWQNIGTVRIGG